MASLTIPKAKTLPFVGDFYRLTFEDPLSYFVNLQKRMGNITRFRLGPIKAILISDPSLVAQVLGRDTRTYIKGKNFDCTRIFLGNGIFVSEGSTWLRHRRMLNPQFTEEKAKNYTDIIASSAHHLVGKWLEKDGQIVDMPTEMCHLAMEVILRSMFNIEVGKANNDYADAVRVALNFIGERGRNPFALPMWAPLPSHIKFKKKTKMLDEYIYRSIQKARKNPLEKSLIGDFISAKDEDGKTILSDEEIKDHVLTVFLAGHETTALALDWTFHLLSQHEDITRKIREEIDTITQGRDIKASDLDKLIYTKQVGQEVMRLYPPICFYPRESTMDQQLGSYHIKKGDQVMLSPYITHRLAKYWQDPEKFDPDRWQPEKIKEQHPFAYFPFGKGRRVCMGQHFAMAEWTLITAIIMQKIDFKMVSKNIKPTFVGTLKPNHMQVKVSSL